MFLGVLLSEIEFELGGLALGPGLAGGLLFAGILLGWLGELGTVPANVPRQARQLVRDLGVMLFIGETGLTAGQDLSMGMVTDVIPTLLVGIIAMLAAVFAAADGGIPFDLAEALFAIEGLATADGMDKLLQSLPEYHLSLNGDILL